MQVTNIMAFGQSDDAALAAAAAIEAASDHPLAKALCLAADSRGLACPTPSDVVAVPGKGLVGKLAGTPHWALPRRVVGMFSARHGTPPSGRGRAPAAGRGHRRPTG